MTQMTRAKLTTANLIEWCNARLRHENRMPNGNSFIPYLELGFIKTSLATAKELIPLVHDLHEKLKAAGIIEW